MKTLLLITFMVISFLPYTKFGKLKTSCTQQERLINDGGSYSNEPYCFAILRKTNLTISITS